MAKAPRVAERGDDLHLDMSRFNIGLHVNEEVYIRIAPLGGGRMIVARMQTNDNAGAGTGIGMVCVIIK
jgi:hypothetical protein